MIRDPCLSKLPTKCTTTLYPICETTLEKLSDYFCYSVIKIVAVSNAFSCIFVINARWNELSVRQTSTFIVHSSGVKTRNENHTCVLPNIFAAVFLNALGIHVTLSDIFNIFAAVYLNA